MTCDAAEREDNRNALREEAKDFLHSLPRKIRTCQAEYSMALALAREGIVTLSNRTRLGNGQVRYDITSNQVSHAR